MRPGRLILENDGDAIRGTRDGRADRESETPVLIDSELCQVRHAAVVRLHHREEIADPADIDWRSTGLGRDGRVDRDVASTGNQSRDAVARRVRREEIRSNERGPTRRVL